MKSKFWSVALALCLCLTLLPGMARAEDTATTEQFDLTPGETYYFDLSGEIIPGTPNDGAANGHIKETAPLPDLSLHYVPFTYTGTINAYALNSSSAGKSASSDAASKANSASTDTEKQYGYTYEHSLFIADFNVSCGVSWNSLDRENLIFGRAYTRGGVPYTMRAPTEGNVMFDPANNEWSVILSKSANYIKNWENRWSWGQDTDGYPNNISDLRRAAGGDTANERQSVTSTADSTRSSYRPVLELPLNLERTALKPVALNLNGGYVGTDASLQNISIIVKNGETFTAPAKEGLTRPDGNADSYFKWLGSDGKLYDPGDSVPASVTSLTAHWTPITYTITYELDGGTNAEDNPASYTYGTGVTSFAAPSKAGYTFKGWYDNADFSGEPVTSISADAHDNITLYAKWEYNYIYIPTVPSYGVSAPKAANGTVSVSPANAVKGATVTVTVTPDKGCTLETLTVTDKDGNALPLTDKGGGKYTFTMPGSAVTVTAAFMEDNNAMLNFFVDVPASAYYYDAVLWAAENGITGGTDAVHFSPDASCTRAQLVTFLYRAAGSPVVNYAMDFSDVSGDDYYAEAVRWAASLGIVGGYGDGSFGSGDTVTREQVAVMLYRFAKAQGKDVSVGEDTNILSYTDALSISDYAFPAMQWACGAGVMQGTDGSLLPQDACTRAQIVTLLFRALAEK